MLHYIRRRLSTFNKEKTRAEYNIAQHRFTSMSKLLNTSPRSRSTWWRPWRRGWRGGRWRAGAVWPGAASGTLARVSPDMEAVLDDVCTYICIISGTRHIYTFKTPLSIICQHLNEFHRKLWCSSSKSFTEKVVSISIWLLKIPELRFSWPASHLSLSIVSNFYLVKSGEAMALYIPNIMKHCIHVFT